jgi:flagellar hook-associated protein 3 FlgL
LKITIGSQTVTIDLSGAQTFQDVLNTINRCGLPVQASIDSTGRRLVIANQVASEALTIGENGGTTATDLGVRTMYSGTTLASLNSGQGVQDVSGNDFEISTSDGSTIDVDMNGLTTVGDVITAINTNPANAGKVTASLNLDGNGICLADATVGANDFQVVALNSSTAAGDLGLAKSVANPGAVINGDDVAPVVENGTFQTLYALQRALQSNDNSAISAAGAAIENQINAVARVRGGVGAKLQSLTQATTDNQNETLQLKSMLSTIRDTDYATATAQFQTLQAAFQASLQVSATVLPTTLMDFLK